MLFDGNIVRCSEWSLSQCNLTFYKGTLHVRQSTTTTTTTMFYPYRKLSLNAIKLKLIKNYRRVSRNLDHVDKDIAVFCYSSFSSVPAGILNVKYTTHLHRSIEMWFSLFMWLLIKFRNCSPAFWEYFYAYTVRVVTIAHTHHLFFFISWISAILMGRLVGNPWINNTWIKYNRLPASFLHHF